ncbi:MAG: hypothetical protein FWE91_09095 [Defluviitaleaceae bacterium]|nr:hypothetical protein [Defluviitaleaceae bacterium]MCL2835792.1 hypothetical protein [Defluviitaleaceae bacterium]
MSEFSSFFNSIGRDRRYLAEHWANYFASFIGNGVFPLPSVGLQVIAGNAGTSVIIRAGRGWINGYFYVNSDELTLQLPIADGVLRRIDRIVIRWDLTERRIFARVNSSAPASNPTPPPLQRDADAWELCLADVLVNAGATSITQSSITDNRWNTALCGIVAGLVQQIDATTITAQFTAFFNEMKPRILEDYSLWTDNIQYYYDLYTQLVVQGHAQFTQDMADFFLQFRNSTTSQFNVFVSLINGFTTDSTTAFQAFLVWLNNFQAQSSANFNNWFDGIKGLLDDDTAGHLLLLIQEIQTFLATDVIGTITHNLGHYPLCTLYKVDGAAGIAGAGVYGAGGGNLFTIPAEFEIDGFDRVTVKTSSAYASCTEINKISDTQYGFADPDPDNLTSLFLIIR